jgi:hypothetical protein
MEAAHRYAVLLTAPDSVLRETPGGTSEEYKSELELQAHWFAGDFGSSFLTATTGERVEIVQFGVWNREAGPDFTDAAVRFADHPGAPVERGAIELDLHAEDWDRHGHGSNPAFDSVVLHLYLKRGARQPFTRTSRHEQVAQVQLDFRQLEERPPLPASLPLAKAGRCLGPLRALDDERMHQILVAAAQYRLDLKNRRWRRLATARGFDEALFQSLAVTLGYKENKLPFALLAQRLPLKLLREEPQGGVALLLGMAGFLHGAEFGGPDARETRAYLRECWERWWPRRDGFERLILPPSAWKLGGLRPVNHPQRRLAALAALARQWPQVRELIESEEKNPVARTMRFLAGLRDEYWDHHYTLTSARSSKPLALIGVARATEMLANVFFPLMVAAHPPRWAEYEKLPAALTNRRVETAATRLFGDADAAHRARWLKLAVHQQGLLQIYEDFCLQDDSDCTRCTFPERIHRFQFKT